MLHSLLSSTPDSGRKRQLWELSDTENWIQLWDLHDRIWGFVLITTENGRRKLKNCYSERKEYVCLSAQFWWRLMDRCINPFCCSADYSMPVTFWRHQFWLEAHHMFQCSIPNMVRVINTKRRRLSLIKTIPETTRTDSICGTFGNHIFFSRGNENIVCGKSLHL